MAREYINDISEITAQYPNYTAQNRKNVSPNYEPVTETIVIPASCKIELDHAIHGHQNISVRINGGEQIITLYGNPLEVDMVGVSFTDVPIIEFHSSTTGATATITYTPIVSVRSAGWENKIEKELEAISINADVPKVVHSNDLADGIIPTGTTLFVFEGFESQFHLPSAADYHGKTLKLVMIDGFDNMIMAQPGEYIWYSGYPYGDIFGAIPGKVVELVGFVSGGGDKHWFTLGMS